MNRYASIKQVQRFYSKRYFLGLDVSTSVTGYTVLNEQAKAIDCGIIDTRSAKNHFVYSEMMLEKLQQIRNTQDGDIQWSIAVEQFLPYNQRSTASILIKLACVNVLTSVLCHLFVFGNKNKEATTSFPIAINVKSARALFKNYLPRLASAHSSLQKKQSIFHLFQHCLPPHYHVVMAKTRTLAKTNFDVTDSMLIAYTSWVMHQVQVEMQQMQPDMWHALAIKYAAHKRSTPVTQLCKQLQENNSMPQGEQELAQQILQNATCKQWLWKRTEDVLKKKHTDLLCKQLGMELLRN